MSALQIRPVTDTEGFEACEALQQQVWGFQDRDVLPSRMFMVIHKIGGLTLGVFDASAPGASVDQPGGRLVAFNLAMPGWRDGEALWHSHMLAVQPEFRNRGLGRQLKLRQREEALARGLERIEWTFDPLEIKNSYFNLEVLGAIARQYHPNLYGSYSSALQAGLPTDRLTAEWHLRSPRVIERLRGQGPAPEGVKLRVEIPGDIYAWKESRDPRALEIQQRNRHAFEAAFAAGMAVVGFDRRPGGDGAFLLATYQDAPAPRSFRSIPGGIAQE